MHADRKGSYVLQDYQGLRLGKRLSEACDDIVAEHGGICYATTNNNAKGLFESCGYEVIGLTTLDVSKWNKPSQTYFTLRKDFGKGV